MIDPKSKSIRSSVQSAFNRKTFGDIEKGAENVTTSNNTTTKQTNTEKKAKDTPKEKRMFDAEITQSQDVDDESFPSNKSEEPADSTPLISKSAQSGSIEI